MIRRSVALACLFVLSGCAVGPDFQRPPSGAGDRYGAAPAQGLAAGADVPAVWWEAFGSADLNALVAEALRANPDLKAAQAALRAAHEDLRATQGAFFPQVQGGFSTSRNKDATGSLQPTAATGAPIYSLTTAQVSVSYTLDVFGGVRRQVEAARAGEDAGRFQMEAAYLTLTANVAATAVQEASARAQIAATESMIKGESDILGILQHQLQLGEIAEVDVINEQATLAQLKASLPPLRQALAQNHNALAVLAGRLPSEEIGARFELDSLKLPGALPLSLPSKLVDQRPDIRAAEANFHAATANVGVATAAMLPNITLTGGAGSVAAFDTLFTPGTGFWSIAAGLTQPIFEGGTLLHKKREAVALADQAAAQYRSTVLSAFENVDNTLHALDNDAAALTQSQQAEQAASQALAITQRQLDLGQVSGLALLNAQRTYQQCVIALVQARAAQFSDTIALFQALGGGWWNRDDVAAAASPPAGE